MMLIPLALPQVSSDVINLILGAGGLAFLTALGRGIQWLLERTSAREDRVERQNRDYQKTLRIRLKYEAQMHDYYRELASRQESVIIRLGGEDALPERRRLPRWPGDEESDEHTQKAIKP